MYMILWKHVYRCKVMLRQWIFIFTHIILKFCIYILLPFMYDLVLVKNCQNQHPKISKSTHLLQTTSLFWHLWPNLRFLCIWGARSFKTKQFLSEEWVYINGSCNLLNVSRLFLFFSSLKSQKTSAFYFTRKTSIDPLNAFLHLSISFFI